MVLFASDLDNTLIYSYKQQVEDLIWVEYKEGKPLSFMTKTAHRQLGEILSLVEFVPITTRSIEQYKRISFFPSFTPQFALTSNGGVLLKNNEIDIAWMNETKKLIAGTDDEMARALELLSCDEDIFFESRIVDQIFFFTKSLHPERTKIRLEKTLDLNQVFVDAVGNKVYVFPKKLHKGLALKRLKEMLKPNYTIASGDNPLFDLPMLCEANAAIIPFENDMARRLASAGKNCLVSQKTGSYFAEDIFDFAAKLLQNRIGNAF